MRLAMPMGMRRRLVVYEEAAGDRQADMFCDLMQAPKIGTWSSAVPALLTRSEVWSMKAGRLLLRREHCRIMGIAWAPATSKLPDKQLPSISGNAMHKMALGSIVLYTFAFTIP